MPLRKPCKIIDIYTKWNKQTEKKNTNTRRTVPQLSSIFSTTIFEKEQPLPYPSSPPPPQNARLQFYSWLTPHIAKSKNLHNSEIFAETKYLHGGFFLKVIKQTKMLIKKLNLFLFLRNEKKNQNKMATRQKI